MKISNSLRETIRTQLRETIAQVEETLKRAKTRIGADQTPRVALVGSPNVGKSSLFNKTIEFLAMEIQEKRLFLISRRYARLSRKKSTSTGTFHTCRFSRRENEEAFAKEATDENAPSPRILASALKTALC